MSRPENPDTTAIFAPRPKLFGDRSHGRPQRNLDDPDQVYDMACEIVRSPDRLVMQISLREIRALAAFAMRAGTIASQFLNVLDLSDAAAPPDAMRAALNEAATVARGMPAGAGAQQVFARGGRGAAEPKRGDT